MIRSMTGYGRGEACDERAKIVVEMKSVNHRYLDLNIRMPHQLNPFEAEVRSLIKERIGRGKLDVFISVEEKKAEAQCIQYNDAVAAEYMSAFWKMQEQFGISMDVSVASLGAMPGVFSERESGEPEEYLHELLTSALFTAIANFLSVREAEGRKLAEDLLEKLSVIEEQAGIAKKRYPEVLSEYRAKLSEKALELLGQNLDEGRLAQEVVLFADRSCVDEELVRLLSHIDQVRKALTGTADGVGRKLDFLAQEMNREANTMLSKSDDLVMTDVGIVLKTEIEKIREQVQNLE